MNDFEMITKALEADMMNHMMTDFINEFGCYAKIYDAADADGNIFWKDWNGNKYFETTEGE